MYVCQRNFKKTYVKIVKNLVLQAPGSIQTWAKGPNLNHYTITTQKLITFCCYEHFVFLLGDAR